MQGQTVQDRDMNTKEEHVRRVLRARMMKQLVSHETLTDTGHAVRQLGDHAHNAIASGPLDQARPDCLCMHQTACLSTRLFV